MPRKVVVSARQQRLSNLKQPTLTTRQRSTIELSDREKNAAKKAAERLAFERGIPYDEAAAILAASQPNGDDIARRRFPRLSLGK